MSKEGIKIQTETQPLVDPNHKRTTYDGQTSSEEDTPPGTYNVVGGKNDKTPLLILNDGNDDQGFELPGSEPSCSFFTTICNFFRACDKSCEEACVGNDEDNSKSKSDRDNDFSTAERLRSFSSHNIL